MMNLLTIDVEDYFQVENLSGVINISEWGDYQVRVEKNTDKILNILSDFNMNATFFVLGWVAERYSEIVKKINNAGHEVASHGYEHKLIFNQTQEEFREDIRKTKQILEDIVKTEVVGYRAPNFSITKDSIWSLDILKDEGFKYDSSLLPVKRKKGGLAEAKRKPYEISIKEGLLMEFPLSTVKIFNKNMSFSGGGFFRLYPYCFTNWAVKEVNREGLPVIFYIHPWEFDPEQPRVNASFMNRFKHYVNLSKTEEKFKRLLGDFEFCSIREYIKVNG